MHFSSLFISERFNGKKYPGIISRMAIAFVIALLLLDFDNGTTGKSIAAGHYWKTKAEIAFIVFIIEEYIYRIHLLSIKWFLTDDDSYKFPLFQFVFGALVPVSIAVYCIRNLLGYSFNTYFDTISSDYNPNESTAYILESAVLLNGIFLACFITPARGYLKTLRVAHEGKMIEIDTKIILMILPLKEALLVFTKKGTFYLAVLEDLGQLSGKLNPRYFSFDNKLVIIRKGFTEELYKNKSNIISAMQDQFRNEKLSKEGAPKSDDALWELKVLWS